MTNIRHQIDTIGDNLMGSIKISVGRGELFELVYTQIRRPVVVQVVTNVCFPMEDNEV